MRTYTVEYANIGCRRISGSMEVKADEFALIAYILFEIKRHKDAYGFAPEEFMKIAGSEPFSGTLRGETPESQDGTWKATRVPSPKRARRSK